MDSGSRTVKANGITLAYRTRAPEDAPPVLLLHCRGADGADRTRIAEGPAPGTDPGAGHEVYGPDHHGDAVDRGRPTSLIPQDQIAVLADLIPDTRLVTLDTGHLVHETRPKEFLAAAETFLAE